MALIDAKRGSAWLRTFLVLLHGDLEDVDHSWLETWRIEWSWRWKIMLSDAQGHILKVWSRSDMIWLWKHKLLVWRTLMVPDWRLEGWGHPWHHRSGWSLLRGISCKFDQDWIWFGRESISGVLGGCWRFLTGNMNDGVIFDIIDQVGRW